MHILLERRSDRVRVEIQVRTLLQGLWANIYERLADGLGRGIRYGELPITKWAKNLVTDWQYISREGVERIEVLEDRTAEVESRLSNLAGADIPVNDPEYLDLQRKVEANASMGRQHRTSLERALTNTLRILEGNAAELSSM